MTEGGDKGLTWKGGVALGWDRLNQGEEEHRAGGGNWREKVTSSLYEEFL